MKKDVSGFSQIRQTLYDLLKGLLVGIVAGAVIALILFIIGFMVGKGQPMTGLEVAKDGLLLLGALGLFILAGMLLIKGKKPERFSGGDGWRRHFKAAGIKMILGTICIALLLLAAAADYLLLWLGGAGL